MTHEATTSNPLLSESITHTLLLIARCRKPEDRTRADKILILLADSCYPGGWVSSLDLALHGGGLCFTARICELRKRGVMIEAMRDPNTPKGEQHWQYRLVGANREKD